MKNRFNPEKHNRHSLRLQGHDYASPGSYFVTLCTQDRYPIFGEVRDKQMFLNLSGEHARECWREIPVHFPLIELDEFIIMPDHIHGILTFIESADAGAKNFSPLNCASVGNGDRGGFRPHGTSKTIGSVIRGFKIGVSKWIRGNSGERPNDFSPLRVWQRSYQEWIIRDERMLNAIRNYIRQNPSRYRSCEQKTGGRGEKFFAPALLNQYPSHMDDEVFNFLVHDEEPHGP